MNENDLTLHVHEHGESMKTMEQKECAEKSKKHDSDELVVVQNEVNSVNSVKSVSDVGNGVCENFRCITGEPHSARTLSARLRLASLVDESSSSYVPKPRWEYETVAAKYQHRAHTARQSGPSSLSRLPTVYELTLFEEAPPLMASSRPLDDSKVAARQSPCDAAPQPMLAQPLQTTAAVYI